MINRVEEIKKKGFKMDFRQEDRAIESSYTPTDFSKIKVGVKTLQDATLMTGDFYKANPRYIQKELVMQAMARRDAPTLRAISDHFFRISGIYSRLCRYMAYLYRYDWLITPFIKNKNSLNQDKFMDEFNKRLMVLENFGIKKFFGEVALKIMRYGCYYGYVIKYADRIDVQELSPEYCRSRYKVKGRPAIEFNMKFFDDHYSNVIMRNRILELYPEDFRRGYRLYKLGKLVGDYPGDKSGWYLLDPGAAFKFNINGEDFPLFIAAIPAIIDLDAAQGLDRQKMAQQLLKIIIQKMPIDKNGDLVFDVDEAQALHNNAVQMLSRAIGIDVLTTFADVDVASMSDTASTTSADDAMARAKQAVYDQFGVSSMLGNTEGNIALEKSILNDEAALYNLIQQFEEFMNDILDWYDKSNKKKYFFRAQILPTTIYNYKEMAKMYKEQTQLGYSKMLPQIALGLTQSAVLANAYFENEILDLVNIFIPPLMSSTMNAEVLNRNKSGGEQQTAGRKELADDQKSEKTIQNIESKQN